MNASMIWTIEIIDADGIIGAPIKVQGWDVLSKLAAVKAAIPATWQAEAYPQVFAEATPDLASAPVNGISYPPVNYSVEWFH